MTPPDIELLAEATYLRAKIAPGDTVSMLDLAGSLLGWGAITERASLPCSARVIDDRLFLRRGLSAPDRAWHIAVALAGWLLEEFEPESTRASVDMLAACLRTPKAAFQPLATEAGPAFSDLAYAFAISESSAALRFGEVTGAHLALIAPDRPVRIRGRKPAKLAKRIVLQDAPNRLVKLFAA